MPTVLETRDATIRFGGHVAVDHVTCGFERGSLTAIVGPNGAGSDDMLDALALLCVARRIRQGTARPFPKPFGRDRYGLPIAIWA